MTVPNRICVGQIGAPHGLRGEVRLRSFTSDGSAIAKYGPLETHDGRSLRILSLRAAKGQFIARLADIGDRNAAEELVNLNLYIPRDRLPDPGDPDEFYHADLVGLAVVDRDGERVGTVVAIHNFGAADLIEIRPHDGGDTEFVQFDATNVPKVDVAAGRIVLRAQRAFDAAE